MFGRFIVFCSIIHRYFMIVEADVSHFKTFTASTNNNQFSVFDGYQYDPPSLQLPSPAPPPLTTFIPQIVANKEPSHSYLPPPRPRPPSSEVPIIIHPPEENDMTGYIPPFEMEEIPPPNPEPPQNYLPPENVPDNQYLPPSPPPPLPPPSLSDEPVEGYPQSRAKQSKFLKHNNIFLTSKSNPLHISVNNLRCLDGAGGYFQAAIVVQSFIDNLPIIDLDTIDSRCQFNLIGVKLILNIPIEDFQRCGIVPCSNRELCVNVRFPQIFGMKSLDDSLLTLKCKVQERVVSKTHAFRFGVSHSGQARNSVVFAHGSGKQNLRTQIGLYRQSGSGFTKGLEAGGFVQLGEELMLRAQVKNGDGWNHSRVSDVSLQRVGPNGGILNSATLIKSNGCINPQMQSICSLPPIFEPPLGYRFGFRAVMFQGMKSGDEMIMNVRIIGCMDHHDCHLDHANCAIDQPFVTSNRIRRQTNNDSNVDAMHEPLVEVSNISFRVMMPSDFEKMQTYNQSTVNSKAETAIIITITVVSFLIIIILIVTRQQKQRPFFVWDWY